MPNRTDDSERDRLDAERYRQLKRLASLQVIDNQIAGEQGSLVYRNSKAIITVTFDLPRRPVRSDDPVKKGDAKALDAIFDMLRGDDK